jgi:hypothetical protein
MKLFFMWSYSTLPPPPGCHVSLRPKYLLQFPILENSQPMFKLIKLQEQWKSQLLVGKTNTQG